MPTSIETFNGDGATTDFTFSFNYITSDHIAVTVDNVSTADFVFLSAQQLRLGSAPASGTGNVKISRVTPTAPLTDFVAGSTLSEEDLDRSLLQSLYVSEEATDALGAVMTFDGTNYDAGGYRVNNLGTPTESTDAVSKAYVDGLAVAVGNVPTPIDPTDDTKVLTAASGVFDWQDIPNQLTAGSVTSTELASDAVTTVKVLDSNITAAKLASDAVTTAKVLDSNITTAKVADNAVTLAKMEHGTSGDMLIYGGSGAPGRLAKGSDADVLTLSSGLPAWTTLSSEWVYDKRTAMSAVQDVDFTMDSGYDYKFIIRDIAPNTDAVNFQIRYSTDGGSTFDSTAKYAWLLSYRDPTATESYSGVIPDNEHSIGSHGNAANETIYADLVVFNPGAASYTKHMYNSVATRTTDGQLRTFEHRGRYANLTPADAIRFRVSTGVWQATGSIDVYKRIVQ